MGGAAAVLGAARALAEIRPPVEVHLVIAACENLISGTAMRPGDIVTASNGRTIEVANTDAGMWRLGEGGQGGPLPFVGEIVWRCQRSLGDSMPCDGGGGGRRHWHCRTWVAMATPPCLELTFACIGYVNACFF